ncbi:hypothetical protein ABZV78_25175 [Micromonospora sp. NPDC004540]|uniref:hypothetical protein n=1 Tax=Micromonospora sp. NPDC004540 TaxID=3154457 RepID=UPI0033A0E952
MTEPDDLLHGAFAAYRAELITAVRPAGAETVRTTVRRRRRRTIRLAAAVTLVAVAAPGAAWAVLADGAAPPAPPAHSRTPAPPESPTPTPRVTPTPTAPSSGPPAAPDGRINRSDLLAARVDLPDWAAYAPASCTTADVRLLPASTRQSRPALLDVRYGDVDGDGASETVALVGCLFGDTVAKQVVGFDRDRAGQVVLLGGVTRTGDGIGDITETAVRSDGTVRVRVADVQACCGDPVRRQWRGYRWDDRRFVQVEGPSAMPSSRSNAPPGPGTIEAQVLQYPAPGADGYRVASMAIEIGSGASAMDHPLVTFPRNERDEPYVELWEYCAQVIQRPATVTCVAQPLAPGERRWTLFPFRTRADGPDGQGTVRLDAGTGADGAAVPGTGRSATFEVRFDG